MSSGVVCCMDSDGVLIESDQGILKINWTDLTMSHWLIQDKQAFMLGWYVGQYAESVAANDENRY